MTANPRPAGAAIRSGQKNIDAVIEAEALLRDSGVTDAPRLEAEALLADLLGIERAELIASYPQPVENPGEYFSRVGRRLRGEPFAYITGKKEFMGLTFSVDETTLIPRPETETLVGCAVDAIGKDTDATIVDIGTGCGCIAVSLALMLPRSSLHAVDISTDALALAAKNAERHGVSRRIAFHAGDACSALPNSLKGRVDAIVSNPPYISDAEYATLDGGIRNFEPPTALKGGTDGLDVLRSISAGAADYLATGGFLAVEIGPNQAEAAADILGRGGIFTEIETVRDLSGRTRIITGRKAK